MHTHIAETALEVENCKEQNTRRWCPGTSPATGMLDTKLLAAHCVHLEKSEMFALKQAGAGVAHCPSSNLKLASGIANVNEMLAVG
jgi:5-methylthioadenosine/S-adenosylhomocysteine deaminase